MVSSPCGVRFPPPRIHDDLPPFYRNNVTLTAALHLGYVYDEFGNTGTITETTTANVLSYDGQSRVTQAFGPTFSYWPSGRFDRFVGLTFTYGTGQAAGGNRSPLHGVVSTAAGGAFTYDLAGSSSTTSRTTRARRTARSFFVPGEAACAD